MKIKSVFLEIKNYLFLQRVLRKESKDLSTDSMWKRYNLRMNWYGRVYTVISLREEDMGEEEMVRNWMAMEKMRPINDYLSSLGLQEIIFPSIEAIPDSRSYLVVYSPIFQNFTLRWVITRSIYLTVALIALSILKNLI